VILSLRKIRFEAGEPEEPFVAFSYAPSVTLSILIFDAP
jgi:hypothetical protein